MDWGLGMLIILVFFLVIILAALFLVGIILFKERKDVGSTWAWFLVLIFVPFIGFFFYIFLGRNLRGKSIGRIPVEIRNRIQIVTDEQVHELKNNEFNQNELLKKYSELIFLNLKSANAYLTADNEISIFSNGNDKFRALIEDIKAAKREINIQYYIIQRDALGREIRDELTKKAKEGVKVRVLYDEVGSRLMTPSFFKELISYGGEVGVFFPSFLKLINFQMNYRNHRKVCIIDGKLAYLGGFNIGTEYLGLHKRFGYWRDTHMKVKGEAVNHIQWRFMLDWYQVKKETKWDTSSFLYRTERNQGHSTVQIISSGPDSESEHIKNMYLKLIMSAKKSILIQTPYFIPDSSFMDACKIALLSGVDLRIMIPGRADKPFVYWATWAYIGELLTYGAKVFRYEKGFLHAKTIVVDHEVASVGTTNIDIRSFRLNFEINALIIDKKAAGELERLFLEDSKVSSILTIKEYNERPFAIKWRESVYRLLSPIL